MRDAANPARWAELFLERLAEAGVRVVGSVRFRDRQERAVYEGADGRQYIFGEQGGPVYG